MSDAPKLKSPILPVDDKIDIPTFKAMASQERAAYMTRGNHQAAAFIVGANRVAHLWDDLLDGDKAISKAEINACFRLALFDLPRNLFYVQHFDDLNRALAVAASNWFAANSLEETGELEAKRVAFICRSDYLNVAIHVALIVGGLDWADHVALLLRGVMHSEGFDHYLMALDAEHRSDAIVRM